MKNLYKYIVAKCISFLIILIVLNFEKSFSQETVIWTNPTTNNASVTGTAPISGVNVTANTSGLNGNYFFQAIPSSSTFVQGRGPWPMATTSAADDVIFNFSQPVIVTNFILTDVNTMNGSPPWNDSFSLFNAGFTASVPNNANVSPSGVNLTQGTNTFDTVNFLCSNPIQNFELHFVLLNTNITTAWLNYRIDLIPIPIIDPVCLNSAAPNFPQIGNDVAGTWNPSEIDTSVAGTFTYVFTPNSGQALTCQVPVTVTVLPAGDSSCCQSILTLASTANDVNNLSLPIIGVRHREAINTITATNLVGIGDNTFQNGVVYHAGDFVDLRPGFDAINGSQFTAYIEGCTNSYAYKKQNIALNDSVKNETKNKFNKPVGGFSIIPNPSNSSVEIIANQIQFNKLEIISIDGRKVFENSIDNANKFQIDVSNYRNGIYIVIITDEIGRQFSQKLVKN